MSKSMRMSLAVVWLVTAVVSLWEWNGMSRRLLVDAGLASVVWQDALIGGGALLDAMVGLCLLLSNQRRVYGVALLAVLVLTVVATVMLPQLWLHPLGPLLKNVPIAVALYEGFKS